MAIEQLFSVVEYVTVTDGRYWRISVDNVLQRLG